ncbi:hypothetical protein [Thioclava sp.]|uniref:hypothetical protein n=1 Tax=Thioclava sp. TaxID=1933450 RepID=UPI003AA7C205
MLEALGEFRVDPNDPSFVSLAQSDHPYTKDVLIQDSLRVNCGDRSGEKLKVSAMEPNNCDPFYRINPINMGASEWYSMEYVPSTKNVAGSGRIVALLDAASAQSATIFAICRIFYKNGRSEDISSRQMEIRKNREKRIFTIDIDDALLFSANNITSFHLLFFIEARNVAIDVYGLSITSIATTNSLHSANDIKRIRFSQKAKTLSRFQRVLGSNVRRVWKGKTNKHRALAKDVFIDFEQGSAIQTSVMHNDNKLIIDFSKATGRWRTLEFRFNEVKNTGTTFALLHFKGMSLPASLLGSGCIDFDTQF